MTGFSEELREQSEIKSEIISKYFEVWTRIMATKSRSDRLGYVDLFAGPGRYQDGHRSTPLKILEHCIARDDLRSRIVTIFNDADQEYADNLKSEIGKLPGIEKLKHPPRVQCSAVGDELVDAFERMKLVPCFAFVDPFGYKGLSSKLIGALIKDWGSDCVFFFNYNRINMGINNDIVITHMNSIFGEERASDLRRKVKGMTPVQRELAILNELVASLSFERSNFVLPFRFVRANGERTSHYLIFVSKHVLGYTIMKDIMWRYSSEHDDGVASFSYVPTDDSQFSFLFEYSRPLDELGDELAQAFRGQTLSVLEIHDKHHVGRQFVLPNYKEALRRLEEQKRITCDPPNRRRIKGIVSMADHVKITFPQ